MKEFINSGWAVGLAILWLLLAAFGPWGRGPKIGLEFKPRDFWVGVYWEERTRHNEVALRAHLTLHVWVCLLPMFPIHFVGNEKVV